MLQRGGAAVLENIRQVSRGDGSFAVLLTISKEKMQNVSKAAGACLGANL